MNKIAHLYLTIGLIALFVTALTLINNKEHDNQIEWNTRQIEWNNQHINDFHVGDRT